MADPKWLEDAKREGRVLVDRGANRAVLPGMEPAEPESIFEAVLPYGPSINHYWRHRIVAPKNGKPFIKVYISGEGEAFQKAVAHAVGRVKPLTGPLSASLLVYPPDAREIDVDNRIKPVGDALAAAGVFFNDKQVQEWHVTLGAIHRPDGMMVVRVVPRGQPA